MFFNPITLIYFTILILCFLSTLLTYFRKSQPLYAKLFPVFILHTIVMEIILRNLGRRGIRTNFIAGNIISIEFVFYFFVLFSIIKTPVLRKALKIILIVFPILAIINRIFIQPGDIFPSYSTNLGGALIVGFCAYGLVDLFLNSPIKSVIRQSEAWIFFGLLVYYGCSFPFFASYNLFDKLTKADWYVLGVIHLILNYILYLSFALSFICTSLFSRKQNQ